MSHKQDAFITRLIGDRYKGLGAPDLATAMASIPLDSMTGAQKSELIDRLLDMPADPMEGVPESIAAEGHRRIGPNDSQGECTLCGHRVERHAGFFFGPRLSGSKWGTCHKAGECSTEPAPTRTEVSEGIWTGPDGEVIMVYMTRNNRLGGKVWNGGAFEYVKGAITTASYGHKMTAEEAAAFGHSTGKCVFCRQPLTDDRSTTVGYGPVCADNNGLPWG